MGRKTILVLIFTSNIFRLSSLTCTRRSKSSPSSDPHLEREREREREEEEEEERAQISVNPHSIGLITPRHTSADPHQRRPTPTPIKQRSTPTPIASRQLTLAPITDPHQCLSLFLLLSIWPDLMIFFPEFCFFCVSLYDRIWWIFFLGFVSIVFLYWGMILYIRLVAEKMWATSRKCVFYGIFKNTTKH